MHAGARSPNRPQKARKEQLKHFHEIPSRIVLGRLTSDFYAEIAGMDGKGNLLFSGLTGRLARSSVMAGQRCSSNQVIKSSVLRPWLLLICILLLQVAATPGLKGVEEEEEEGNIMDEQTDEERMEHLGIYEECMRRMRTELPPDDGYTYCNMTFDTWDCWNYTRAGDVMKQPCPAWIPGSDPREIASKMCTEDGQWFRHPETNETWTNYTTCRKEESSSNIHIIYYMGYGLSVVSLCIASFIFFYFRSLGCPRVTIHKNLFISFILCGIVWIQWFALVTQNPETIKQNPPYCKVLLVLGQYFNTCNYFWMLSEGLYLHTVIVVAVFSENHRLHLYYIIGWVLPAVPVCIYTGFMVYHDPGLCWLSESRYEWCVASFIILVLCINLILLLNIVRILVTKLRATPMSGSGRNYTRAVRATLILLPLLGLHYIILPVRPSGKVAEAFYNYFMGILLSFQGFFVACIFCFFNGEAIPYKLLGYGMCCFIDFPLVDNFSHVKMQIRRKWYSYRWGHRGSVFGGRYGNVNTTITETVSTMTPNDRRSMDKGQNSPLLNRAPPPVQNSLGNGKTKPIGEEPAAEADQSKRIGDNNPNSGPTNGNWDCNGNADQDNCPSILIEDHDEPAPKTTEV